MVCTYDSFGKDEPIYYFQNYDKNLDMPLDDETFKIVLNTACTPSKVPEGLKALYEYINDPARNEGSALVKAIDERVKKFNGPDWRWRQVTLEYMVLQEYNKGKAEGIEIGREEGREEGRAEGREEGRAEGREEGRAEGREEGILSSAVNLQKNQNISFEEALHLLGVSEDAFSRYREMLIE